MLFEKDYASIKVILDTLQQITSLINFRIDELIPKAKTVWPDLPAEAIEVLEEQIAVTMNEYAI